MAYTPKTWQCGEPIMADDLNHMEQGIAQGGSGSLIVTMTPRAATAEECPTGGRAIEFSHSWQEIHDAMASGRQVYINVPNGYVMVLACASSPNYAIAIANDSGSIDWLPFISSTSKIATQCSVV